MLAIFADCTARQLPCRCRVRACNAEVAILCSEILLPGRAALVAASPPVLTVVSSMDPSSPSTHVFWWGISHHIFLCKFQLLISFYPFAG